VISGRPAGFTLIEMLVALAITAVVAVMAYGGLRSALEARDVLQAQERRLTQVQILFQLLSRDLRHLQPRPVTNEFEEFEPALRSEFGVPERLRLTRNGWQNFADAPRSSLQRVVWRVEDDRLLRGYWPVLDRSGELPLIERTVIDEVLDLRLRFLDLGSGAPRWLDAWPPQDRGLDDLPAAVEVTLELEGTGRLQRVFLPLSP
jgi:general secretion pathway protein J